MHNLTHWLFAAPWWILAIGGAAAVAFLLFALSRRDRRLTRIAGGVAALVVLWVLAGLVIATPVERARDRTEAMINAYENSDWDALSALIDPETRFANMLKGHDIVLAAQRTHEEMEHGEILITRVESNRDDLGILVDVRIISEQKSQYVPRLSTAWRFDYRKRGEDWKLEQIEPLPTDTMDKDTILRNVRLPPELADQR
jgi:hypothetical protein